MARKISEKKREALWVAYQEKQSFHSVAQKCQVARQTVKRYAVRDKWEERFAKIRDKATKLVDDDAARRKARHIKSMQLLQARGIEGIHMTEDMKKKVRLKPRDAIKALVDGVKTERQICGDEDAQPQEGTFTLNINLVSSKGE